MLDLVAISYSPWSEKARWALDHHGVQYQEQGYLPMLGEPALRTRLKQWRGPISVPILFVDETVMRGSLLIAQYAEEIGANATDLFPDDEAQNILAWNERSEAALSAGRALVSQRVLQDPAAKREALPAMPGALRSVMAPLANVGVGYLRRKYSYDDGVQTHRRSYEQILHSLADALHDGRSYLLGDRFTYADLCMAVALQCVRPVTDEFLKLGPATRLAWTDDLLAGKFPALLDWRDQIYESHR